MPSIPKILLPITVKTLGSMHFSESNTLYFKDLYLINKRVKTKNEYMTIFGPNKSGDMNSFKSIISELCKALITKLIIIYIIGIKDKNLKNIFFYPLNILAYKIKEYILYL